MNVDMFICRAKLAGTPQKITEHTDAIVINAGDGKHQHPTQAMLDLYTIRENFGHLDGLKVAIVGDLSHSRVCGSLVPALKTMGADVTLVGPPTFQVDDPDYYGVPQTADLDAVIPEMDVVYMLRVQLERMEGAAIPSRREYNRLWGLDMERVNRMKPEAIICHPGPHEPRHGDQRRRGRLCALAHTRPGERGRAHPAWPRCTCFWEERTMAFLLKSAHVVTRYLRVSWASTAFVTCSSRARRSPRWPSPSRRRRGPRSSTPAGKYLVPGSWTCTSTSATPASSTRRP